MRNVSMWRLQIVDRGGGVHDLFGSGDDMRLHYDTMVKAMEAGVPKLVEIDGICDDAQHTHARKTIVVEEVRSVSITEWW